MPLPQGVRERVDRNLTRVRDLVELYEAYAKGQGRRGISASDVLRAAVVLLHATLEEFLRVLAASVLPAAKAEVLDGVPLLGQSGRPEKFFLGALAKHRGKTIDGLITASVTAHLNRANYGGTKEIAALLQSLGVSTAKVNGRFGDLEGLMERRHHIVHQANKNPARGRGQHWAKSIGRKDVLTWIDAVRGFVRQVDKEIH